MSFQTCVVQKEPAAGRLLQFRRPKIHNFNSLTDCSGSFCVVCVNPGSFPGHQVNLATVKLSCWLLLYILFFHSVLSGMMQIVYLLKIKFYLIVPRRLG